VSAETVIDDATEVAYWRERAAQAEERLAAAEARRDHDPPRISQPG